MLRPLIRELRVFVAEEDGVLRAEIARALRQDRYTVIESGDGASLPAGWREWRPGRIVAP
jgi:hypothetical protein